MPLLSSSTFTMFPDMGGTPAGRAEPEVNVNCSVGQVVDTAAV